jgi:outer membrane protein TolC
MIRFLAALPALLLALPAHYAQAGYRDLVRDADAYRPPALYGDSVWQAPLPGEPVAESAASGISAQLDELRRQALQWQQALADRGGPTAFFTPEPQALTDLGGTVGDDALAARALADGFPLQTLETLVWLRNPAIGSAQRGVRAALQRYDQAANLDDILRRYQAFTAAVMPGVGPMKGRGMPQMAFPYPDMVALKGQVVNQEVAAAMQGLEMARRDALTAARKTYWDLVFLGEAVRVSGEMQRLLGDLLAVATTRYESGKASFQDVIKVRIRLDTVIEELTTLKEKRLNAGAAIRKLLALPTKVTVGRPAPGDPPRSVPDLEPLYARALEHRQELKRMDAMIGKMERMVAMGELRVHADPTLNLSLYPDAAVTQVGTARMQEPFEVVTPASTGSGTPIKAWYGSGEAYLRETREKLAALREQRRDLESMVLLQVRQAWFSLDQAAREDNLYRGSVVELSETALDVSTRGYETGGVMFADVIASHSIWLQAQLGAERRRADLGVARAELAAAVGVDLGNE